MRRFSDRRIFALVCLNAALYVFILVFDSMKAACHISYTQGLVCDILKYIAIISCLFICVFALSHERKKVAQIQMVVFCITLGADFFLLFTNLFSTGVLIFIFAHACALLRYKPKWLLPIGIVAASLFVIIMTVMRKALSADIDIMLIVAACVTYAILIISVTISTFHAPQPRLNEIFSRTGMLLFLACDVNVFIFNSVPAGAAPHTAAIVLMWLFYLPAQTMLALSATSLPLINRRQADQLQDSESI